jgi:hypothetical protein
LRELLEKPIPAGYLGEHGNETPLLCDLDESSWDRFGDEVCRKLAGEVVRSVGRAARLPMAIAERTVPPLPRGMGLADLELDARTRNCLIAAGMDRRPQDLRSMTMEGLLALRGFWVRSLVDLLTSIEHVIEHPEARRRGKARTPRCGPRASGRYPRPGQRLAPETLRCALQVPIPGELCPPSTGNPLRLCDLDESTWSRFAPDQIAQLARMVVSRVATCAASRAIRGGRVPKLPQGVRLEDVCLENRTYRCLERAGFARKPRALSNRTIGELLDLDAFGAKCLVDLLCSLEALHDREGRRGEKLTAEAESLGRLAGAAEIHFSDPRLRELLRSIDPEANTVGELVSRLRHRRLGHPNPVQLVERIERLRQRIEELIGQTLEDELLDIFALDGKGRDRDIVADYYGWKGRPGQTLEALGRRHNLSRERIRQVCVRAVKRVRGTKVFAPVLDRALSQIARRLPAPAETIEEELVAAGLTACGMRLEAIGQAAELLSRRRPFVLESIGARRLAIRPDCEAIPQAIVQAARRAVLTYGATTVRAVAAEVSSRCSGRVDHALVEATLEALDDFEWLSSKGGWFQLESLPQYGLPNMVEKVLAVSGEIEVSKLRAAILRYRRGGREVPPAAVLREFCRRLPGVRAKGRSVVADPRRDWREVLSGVEARMVGLLEEHGPVLERGVFEDLCVRRGINRFSFSAVIMCSPVIAQYGRSIYGLVGAKVDRRAIRRLVARKPNGLSGRVLQQFGATDDGQIYLAYRLSKAAISGGVITVPAAMKERLQGKFALRSPDGQPAGTLVSKDGCAWGLGPVLRGQATSPGDHLLILFDTLHRVAEVHLGDAQVLPRAAGPLQAVS